MSRIAMQTVIARLCVDHSFRECFRREADRALQSYDLSASEIDALVALDLDALSVYADGLVRKRVGTIARWFPLTFTAMRKALPAERRLDVLNGYGYGTIRESDDIGGEWVKSESRRFQKYLASLVESGELDMPYLTELLELETIRRTMAQDDDVASSSRQFARTRRVDSPNGLQMEARPLLGHHVCLRQFTYDIVTLIETIENGDSISQPPLALTWVLFLKVPRRAKITLHTVTGPVQEILDLCDGTRTAAEILDRMASRHTTAAISRQDVQLDCQAVLEQCYKAGILTFVAA